MDTKTAAQIAGIADYITAEPIDCQIADKEHSFAVEIAHEMAKKHGIDLNAHIAGQIESERAYALSIGYVE